MTKLHLLASLTLLAGCVSDPELDTTEQELAGNGVLWPGGIVRVCWETRLAADGSGQAQNPHDRADWPVLSQAVEDVMRSSWGRSAQLEFVGFADCPANTPEGNAGFLAINIARNGNASGAATDIGYHATRWTRMRLDPAQYAAGTELFRGQVMHETGHGLGFHHEWDRADNPHHTGCEVADDNTEANTTRYYGTDFDLHSIMNFSYDQGEPQCKLPQPFALSPWDIVGVQNAYGRRTAGTLAAASGNCLTWAPYPENRPCSSDVSQQWQLRTDATIAASYDGNVVTVPPSAGTYPGFPVMLAPRTSPPLATQRWSAPSGFQVRGIGDMCLDVPNSHYANGQTVQIYACNSGNNQRWRVYSDRTIRPIAASGYCLDVPNGTATPGNRLQLFACHGGASQQFSWTNQGEIKFGATCLDVAGARPASNAVVQLYTCKVAGDLSRVNQLWHLTGSVVNSVGECLGVRYGHANDVGIAQQEICNGAASQTWDYYVQAFTGF